MPYQLSEVNPKKLHSVVRLSDEEYLAQNEVEFRARFRERVHHTLEIQTYAAAYRHKSISASQANAAKHLSNLWEKRGLSTDLPDYQYAKKLIEYAQTLEQGDRLDLSENVTKTLTDEEKNGFFTTVYQRRSVREFTNQRVPDELIDEILKAGLWAAHSCNLQSIRYLIVREENDPGLFQGSDVPGGPVHLVVCQDERVYQGNLFMPLRNRLLDAGAAAQNIALAAHAIGLAGVWLTFNDTIIQRLRERYNLPEYINIVTYVDVGFGDQTPFPPLRQTVEEAVLAR